MKCSDAPSLNGNGRVHAVEPGTLNNLDPCPLEASKDWDSQSPGSVLESPQLASSATPTAGAAAEPTPLLPKHRPIKAILAVAGLGAIAAGAFGYNYWQYASSHEETDDATVAGHIHQISARIPGTVQDVLVNDNQLVKKGQLLVKLDPTDYQIKLQQAQADLAAAQQKANTAQVNVALSAKNAEAAGTQSQGDVAKAQAAIAQAQAQVIEAQAGVPQAQAQLAQAQANWQKAQADFNRFATLFNEGAVTQRDLDTARQAYQVTQAQINASQEAVRQAQAKLAQARQAVATAQAGLTAAQGGIQQAQAKSIQTQVSRSDFSTAQMAIAQAQVVLKNAQQQLSYTKILAPADGKIGRKTVEVGQQVQPGTPLMALVSNEYWVTANFKETQLSKMRPGQKVEIKLDSFPGKKFEGRVDSIAPASGSEFALLPPDNATGNFTKVVQRIPVKIVFDSQSIKGYESMIAPGMSAVVTVDLK
ncbi:HlyD family secretion protein [Leptodesmis sp.]|uniref:HlyD family secretion protein n=1 Tax=Leptodesmis sp. TaxID=3100501 RepID=UPI0040534B9E